MKVRTFLFSISVLYTGLILYLSLMNLADTPVKDLGVSDKVMHGGAYFGLGLLWMLYGLVSFEEKELFKKIVVISVISIAFGIFIEVLQDTLTDYRQLDFYDIVANTIGVVIAGLLVWIFRNYLIRLKAKINLILMKN